MKVGWVEPLNKLNQRSLSMSDHPFMEVAEEILQYLADRDRIPRDRENKLILEHVKGQVALEAKRRGYDDEETRQIVKEAIGRPLQPPGDG
jgi:hypothetical protein